jgi:hypothetical protein
VADEVADKLLHARRLSDLRTIKAQDRQALARSGDTVIAFESGTADMMLRSRVMQALEVAVGPDWQSVARLVG